MSEKKRLGACSRSVHVLMARHVARRILFETKATFLLFLVDRNIEVESPYKPQKVGGTQADCGGMEAVVFTHFSAGSVVAATLHIMRSE